MRDAPNLNQPVKRLPALDGLRGVAALVVVFWHVYLLASSHFAGQSEAHKAVYGVLAHSPLKLLIAGDQAVVVFFVLSGLVITLPVLQKANFSWSGYYPARLLRLYIPVWASLVFAAGLLLLIPRTTQISPLNGWIDAKSARQYDPFELLTESLAVFSKDNFSLNNPLWSIWWEILFSLLLPLFIAAALVLRKHMAVSFALCLLVIFAGSFSSNSYLTVLPLFELGVLIAVHRERLQAWLGARGRAFAISWVVLSLFALIASQMFEQLLPPNVLEAMRVLQAAGAVGLVLAAYMLPQVSAFFSARLPRFLGRISFSVYLLHVPLLVSLAYLFGPSTWLAPVLVGLILLIPLAYLFTRFIEKPATAFGRWVGARVSARLPQRGPISEALRVLGLRPGTSG